MYADRMRPADLHHWRDRKRVIGISQASERINGARYVDALTGRERSLPRRASASERGSRDVKGGLAHDVSTLLGIGRHLGRSRVRTPHHDHAPPQRGMGKAAHVACP